MKKTRYTAMAAGLVAAAGLSVAVAQQGQGQRPGQTGSQPAGQQTGQDRSASEKDVAKSFIKESIRGNMFEIAAAEHVAENAQNQAVKQFARQLAQDHERLLEQVKQTAQQMEVEAPEEMHEWQQAMIDHMKELESPELDREFVFHQVGAHTTKVVNHQFVINNAEDQQVTQLAQQSTQSILQHLQQAQRIAEQLVAGREAGAQPDIGGAPRSNR